MSGESAAPAASRTGDYRIRGLDGLRAIAVALVFLQHRTALVTTPIGHFGVSMFFVLSGFLIVNILYEERLAIEAGLKSTTSAIIQFFARRSFRIFPIYYIVLVLTIPLFLVTTTHGGKPFGKYDDVYNFLYLSNVWQGSICKDYVGYFTHLWSLSIEEQFYIISAIAILVVPSRFAIRFCAAIFLFGFALRIYLHMTNTLAITIDTSSFVNFSYIAFGGLCVLALKHRRPENGRERWWAPALLLALLVLPFVIYAFEKRADLYLPDALAPLIAGPLIIVLLKNQDQWLVTVLEFWPLRVIGKVSYGIYLYHLFIGAQLIELISNRVFHHTIHVPAQFLVSLIGTLIVATLSWNLIEKPILRLRPSQHAGPHELPAAAA